MPQGGEEAAMTISSTSTAALVLCFALAGCDEAGSLLRPPPSTGQVPDLAVDLPAEIRSQDTRFEDVILEPAQDLPRPAGQPAMRCRGSEPLPIGFTPSNQQDGGRNWAFAFHDPFDRRQTTSPGT